MKRSSYPLVVATAAACVILAGCSGRGGAEAAVREALKDPDSAKFGEFYYNDKTKKACLTTNAKNAMGGYTGDRQVQLTRDDDGWTYVDEKDYSPADCREYYADEAG